MSRRLPTASVRRDDDMEWRTEQARLQFLKACTSTIRSRAELMSQMGKQYYNERDLYKSLGWKKDPDYNDYLALYNRTIGKTIIDAPVDRTWAGEFEITTPDLDPDTDTDDDEEESNAWLDSWRELARRIQFFNKANRVDKLTGIGKYGALFLGFNDGKPWNEPVEPSAAIDLLYVTPLGETSCAIATVVQDVHNERYGKPESYNIQFNQTRGENSDVSTSAQNVHWTRVLHLVRNNLESEVYGASDLEAPFNYLQDLMKISGGSAEMFWRGAFPGMGFMMDPEMEIDDDMRTAMGNEIEEYMHSMRRYLRLKGVDVREFKPQAVDPTKHYEVQIQQISAITRIPKRILTGSERGELASSQDERAWNSSIEERQNDFAEPYIVRGFIDRMIEFGVLADPGAYEIQWPDLNTKTDQEIAEYADKISGALEKYKRSGAQEDVMPPEIFLKKIMGFEDDEIEEIINMVEAGQELEEELMRREVPDFGDEEDVDDDEEFE